MVPFLIIASGMAGWVIFFRARKRIQVIQTWPITPAIIAESHVEKTYRHANVSHGSPRRPMYTPRVKYAYHVADVDYRNDAISPVGSGSRHPTAAQSTVDRYPPGHQCDVRYNPDRPQEAYLEPGNINDARLFAIVGTVAIAVGLLLIDRV